MLLNFRKFISGIKTYKKKFCLGAAHQTGSGNPETCGESLAPAGTY